MRPFITSNIPPPPSPTWDQPLRPSIFTPTFSASDEIVLEEEPSLRDVHDFLDPGPNAGELAEYRLASVIDDGILRELEGRHIVFLPFGS